MTIQMMAKRFRGFFPVVVDIETSGFDPKSNAILEVAMITLKFNDNQIEFNQTYHHHILPFEGAVHDSNCLNFNQIDPLQPLRFAIDEQKAITDFFNCVKEDQKNANCNKCVLVGHNAWFDLHFINEAVKRHHIKRSPFHSFTSFDTASLSAFLYGHTVLAKAAARANIDFDTKQGHSALYDATKTAELFCKMINSWPLPDIFL